MDKFINAFSRSQYKKDEEGRSYQFAKRLSTTTATSISSPYSAATTKNSIPGPTLTSSYLSVIELDIYNKWWEGLDPFGLGVAHEEAVHPFLESSGLEINILQQIFDLYSGEIRYTEEQFFAILRLIAHIQNGRRMNRDLVALGAPLPQFSHDSVDPLIPQTNTNQSINNATDVKYTKTNSNSNNNRNSWWGQTLQQSNTNYNHTPPSNNNSIIPTNMTTPSQDSLTCNKSNHPHRHSYADSTLSKSTFVSPAIQTPNINSTNMNNSGPSPVHNHHNNILASSTTNISPHFNKNNNNNSSLANNINNLEWAEQALSNTTPLPPSTSTSLLNSQQNKLNISSPKITTNKGIYTHSRSRSVPFAAPSTSINDFIFDTVTSTQTKHDQQQQQQQRPPLMPSRSSIDSASFHRLMQQQEQQNLDYGQSLLLTQKFVPLASTIKSTNPFEDDDNDDDEEEDEEKEEEKEENIKERNNDHYHHHQEGNMNNNNNTYNNGIHTNQQQSLQPDLTQPLHQQFLKSPFEDSDNEENSDSENEHHEFLHHTATITSTTSKASTPITSNNINHNNNMSLLDSDDLDFNILSINNKPNSQHALPPPVPAQSTKPPFPRNSRHQTLKRSQSQYNGHTHSHPHKQHPFMTQGEFLLATSTSSHSIEFPVDPFPSLSTSSNTNSNSIHRDNFHSNSTTNNQLFRHRSTSSVSRR